LQPPADQIAAAAIDVLLTAEADAKAEAAHKLRQLWRSIEPVVPAFQVVPDRPARPSKPELLAPAEMPKRRKGGNQANRIALIHAIAHIELNAIDLAADMVVRFGPSMPAAFTADWIQVADEEAKHFGLLQARLRALGSFYGALPAHDGLWQASFATKEDIAGRLAVVPMVLEARGLDVTPPMIKRLRAQGDVETAEILDIIYREEVGHVGFGSKWFHYVTGEPLGTGSDRFQQLVKTYFHGDLKPPFNTDARNSADLPADYYAPLSGYLI